MKANTFQLAMSRAAKLPVSAQEQIGREMLECIDAIAELHAEPDFDIDLLDGELVEGLDAEESRRSSR